MKKIISLFIVFLSLQAVAQYNFQKIISNANATYARDVIQASDTGFYITGSSSGYGDYSANAFLMKLDKQGNFEWVKNYGGNNADWAVRFVQNTDKSLVFAGYSNSGGNGGYDTWVFKTDSLGNLLWEKRFGGSDWDFGKCIIATNDGGYMVCGETYSFGNGNNDAFLLKLDANGDSLWMQTYGGASNDWAEKVIQTQDGSYVFIGSTNTGPTSMHEAIVIKTDQNGAIIWQQLYGSDRDDFGTAIVESPINKNLIFVGNTDSTIANEQNMFTVRADSLGDILCYYELGGTLEESVNDITLRFNDQVAFVGQTFSYGFYGDMVFYATDPGCWWAGGGTYGQNEVEIGWGIKSTSDNGLVMIGDSKSGPGISNILIVKIDQALNWPPPMTFYFDVTSTPEIESSFLNIYPNPGNGIINFNLGKITTVSVEIYSIDGRKLATQELYANHLDISHLANGIYTVLIHDKASGQIYYSKYVLQK